MTLVGYFKGVLKWGTYIAGYTSCEMDITEVQRFVRLHAAIVEGSQIENEMCNQDWGESNDVQHKVVGLTRLEYWNSRLCEIRDGTVFCLQGLLSYE